MAVPTSLSRLRPMVSKLLIGGLFLIVVVVLMIWLAGGFHAKVGGAAGVAAGDPGGTPLDPNATTTAVRSALLPRTETAVGTVRAVHETAVASKLLAKVIEVNVSAGQQVQADQVLIRLDSTDLQARAEQAAAVPQAWRAHCHSSKNSPKATQTRSGQSLVPLTGKSRGGCENSQEIVGFPDSPQWGPHADRYPWSS